MSVKSLDELLDPKWGKKSPHPFYIDDTKQRADITEFLRGLDTDSEKTKDKVAAKIIVIFIPVHNLPAWYKPCSKAF